MKLIKTMAVFLLCSACAISAAAPLRNIVIFGDSLSDNGNLYEFMKHQLPQSPPYFEGRFSNGPIWIEHLIASYFPENPKAHLLDYAIGGAGVSENDDDDGLFTLRQEVDTYFSSHKTAEEDSLYIVLIGGNNYLGMPDDIEQVFQDVNAGITHNVERLVHKGAKYVMLINLPDMGSMPAALEFGTTDIFNYYSTQHNKLLHESFNKLKQQYPEVNWLFFDLNKTSAEVSSDPEHFGFKNVTGTCVEYPSSTLVKKPLLEFVAQAKPRLDNDACDGFLFFDLVHPTTAAHKFFAGKMRKMLDDAGIEFSKS